MNGKRIIITGGTGYLGQWVIRKYYKHNEITVFSRDEAKQVYLKKQFPKVRMVLGDIRDYRLLNATAAGHEIGIFCASLKHVSAVNENAREAHEVIVGGSMNSRAAAIAQGFESACFVSTDKSRLPITLYGAMKFVAGESFIWRAEHEETNLSTVICGNIMNSTGSVIPMIWNAIKSGSVLPLYSERMARFTILGADAADLIDKSLGHSGSNIIPKLKAFAVPELFQLFAEHHGLQFKLVRPKSVERETETLIAKEEAPRATDYGDYYAVHHLYPADPPAVLVNGEYSSQDHLMSKQELDELLSKHDYFKP